MQTVSQRSRNRVSVYGKRVIINTADKFDFEAAMMEIRRSKRTWSKQAWGKRVEREVRAHWDGHKHGGKRRRRSSSDEERSVVPACGGRSCRTAANVPVAPRGRERGSKCSTTHDSNCAVAEDFVAEWQAQERADVLTPFEGLHSEQGKPLDTSVNEAHGALREAPDRGTAADPPAVQRGVPRCVVDGNVAVAVQAQQIATESIPRGTQHTPSAADFSSGESRCQPVAADLSKNFVVKQKMGGGSFGEVFACAWGGRELAVKIQLEARLSTTREDAEIRISKRLALHGGHQCIVNLVAWCRKEDGTLYLLFPRFSQDLHNLVNVWRSTREQVGAEHMMHFTSDLCAAVAFMHARSVVHRDLKPSNILVRQALVSTIAACGAAYWQPVICDFGNSKLLLPALESSRSRRQSMLAAAALTGAAQVTTMTREVTTLWYAAPEMLVPAVPYSSSIDVWALGLILAEVENREHACSTPASATNWEQLLEFWIHFALVPQGQHWPPIHSL